MSELDKLLAVWKENPELVKQAFIDNPDLRAQFIELDDTYRAGESVSVDGFKRFYQEIYGRELPYVDLPVAELFTWAYYNKKGVVYEAWRGKGKSTFFAAWCPYVLGCNPKGSTTLVRVNGDKAKEMGKLIADIIQTNPGWKKIFPHVIPDERAGWSVENGFNVMDTRVTGAPGSKDFENNYAKWRMACLADHLSEKSLLCAGIESGSIIGLHPTNGMWFDDLHDELNTRSHAELKKVVDILKGNVFPTWFSAGGSPTLGVFCTPWSKNPPDAYQVMLETGLFKHVKMPIYTLDPEGEIFPPTGERVRLTWPEMFPMSRVAEMYRVYGTRFGQMCLCDIELSKPKNMRYQSFPAKDIDWKNWPQVQGVDPVAWVKGVSTGEGISHFAVAQFLKSPYNTLIVGDGIIEHIDALEGEKRIAELQRLFKNSHASIEADGAGALWIALITRAHGIRYHSHKVSEIARGNKKQRQYQFLQPLFASGSILISDGDTDFLNACREYLDVFPNFTEDSYLCDVGDALVMGALDVPEIWTKIVVHSAAPELQSIFTPGRKRKADPYAELLEGRR